ncbi:hypothetical protein [Pseudoalteromonas ulvae]|uniref:hypothetical protein n=1 Tax=Pseudoalteromonas ulvae TaxID=107327 RepID=UPI001592C9B0|nr:hypothetical protein [Pseudoalteromonas ulvae]
MQNNKSGQWLTSKQTQAHLKITGCKLMHLRETGKLKFEKRGRAFYYYFDNTTIKNELS